MRGYDVHIAFHQNCKNSWPRVLGSGHKMQTIWPYNEKVFNFKRNDANFILVSVFAYQLSLNDRQEK